MIPNVKRISIYELKPNMILAEDLMLNGLTLVPKKVSLNAMMIKKIFDFYPSNTTYIYTDEKKIIAPSIQTPEQQNLIETENLLNHFSNNVYKFLESIEGNSKLDLTEIRTMSKEILDNNNNYSSILKNITNSRNVDEYLTRHSVNVAFLSSMLGKWLKLPQKDLTLLTYAAFLHDIGKVKVNQKILNKPSKLTRAEFEEIKKHSVYSYELVRNIPYLDESVSLAVLMHHERLDGSGYPLHLKDAKINIYAKIIGIADTFDAMTSDKVYSKKLNPFKVLEIMQHEGIATLDYYCLTTFINQMLNYYTGETVKLSDNRIAKIVKTDINNISKPLISIDLNSSSSIFIDLNLEKDLFILDLAP